VFFTGIQFRLLLLLLTLLLLIAYLLLQLCLYYRMGQKNDPSCFCKNFVKFPPNLIIFDAQIAKKMKLCEAHALSTSPNLCQCTTV